jgi:hypothetical protein
MLSAESPIKAKKSHKSCRKKRKRKEIMKREEEGGRATSPLE